jgi:hypothetical protein
LIPTADPKNIRLVRPPRGGKPARIYKRLIRCSREMSARSRPRP